MEVILPISSPFSPFVVSANGHYDPFAGSEQIISKYYFHCNHLVYRDGKPSHYKGYQVRLYQPCSPINESFDSDGFLIFVALTDPTYISVSCNDVIERFYTFKIIYPKSALFDYWLIKSRYEITDYDEHHYNHEGFVIRFESGLRLKFKGSEYCRIQKLLNGITPLGIWELMKEQANLVLIRQEIPEEYWSDFDTIEKQLTQQLNDLIDEVETYHLNYQHLSDKELGLKLDSLPLVPRSYLFQRRKKGKDWYNDSKSRASLFNHFRPKDNQLI